MSGAEARRIPKARTWAIITLCALGLPPRAVAQDLRNVTRSPANESAVAWSPDSRRLLVSSDRAGDFDIYLVPLDELGLAEPLFRGPGDQFVGGWAPDGRISFVWVRDGDPEIYVAPSSSGAPENVSRDPGRDWLPSWGPGGELVYNTTRFGGLAEIVVWEPRSGLVRVTDNEFYDAGAELSPNGDGLVYHSRRDDNYDLYLRPVDGGVERRLTSDPADDSYGSWSPDGARIVFRSGRDGNDELYVMTLATGAVSRLLYLPDSNENYPAWSPDGHRIAFVSDRDGNQEIYVINVSGPRGAG